MSLNRIHSLSTLQQQPLKCIPVTKAQNVTVNAPHQIIARVCQLPLNGLPQSLFCPVTDWLPVASFKRSPSLLPTRLLFYSPECSANTKILALTEHPLRIALPGIVGRSWPSALTTFIFCHIYDNQSHLHPPWIHFIDPAVATSVGSSTPLFCRWVVVIRMKRQTDEQCGIHLRNRRGQPGTTDNASHVEMRFIWWITAGIASLVGDISHLISWIRSSSCLSVCQSQPSRWWGWWWSLAHWLCESNSNLWAMCCAQCCVEIQFAKDKHIPFETVSLLGTYLCLGRGYPPRSCPSRVHIHILGSTEVAQQQSQDWSYSLEDGRETERSIVWWVSVQFPELKFRWSQDTGKYLLSNAFPSEMNDIIALESWLTMTLSFCISRWRKVMRI